MEKPFYMSATKITLILITVSIITLNFMQIEAGEPLKSIEAKFLTIE